MFQVSDVARPCTCETVTGGCSPSQIGGCCRRRKSMTRLDLSRQPLYNPGIGTVSWQLDKCRETWAQFRGSLGCFHGMVASHSTTWGYFKLYKTRQKHHQ